jgi:hypothetical protein
MLRQTHYNEFIPVLRLMAGRSFPLVSGKRRALILLLVSQAAMAGNPQTTADDTTRAEDAVSHLLSDTPYINSLLIDREIPILGGKEKNISIGLNWYLNKQIRLMTNLVKVLEVDRPGSIYDGEDPLIFSLRAQWVLD